MGSFGIASSPLSRCIVRDILLGMPDVCPECSHRFLVLEHAMGNRANRYSGDFKLEQPCSYDESAAMAGAGRDSSPWQGLSVEVVTATLLGQHSNEKRKNAQGATFCMSVLLKLTIRKNRWGTLVGDPGGAETRPHEFHAPVHTQP